MVINGRRWIKQSSGIKSQTIESTVALWQNSHEKLHCPC